MVNVLSMNGIIIIIMYILYYIQTHALLLFRIQIVMTITCNQHIFPTMDLPEKLLIVDLIKTCFTKGLNR